MMKKLLPITALVLGLSSGAALADRVVVEHGRPAARRETVVVREHGGYGYHGGGRVVVHENVGYRRPIYMNRPVIREHYYNYHRRPGLIVEEYGPRPGYIWVRGHWGWNGGEWMWTPGYYNPM
ncbi:MAG TPA: YXWGXW repeat-containing protein [Kofleriaceae bacterium]